MSTLDVLNLIQTSSEKFISGLYHLKTFCQLDSNCFPLSTPISLDAGHSVLGCLCIDDFTWMKQALYHGEHKYLSVCSNQFSEN